MNRLTKRDGDIVYMVKDGELLAPMAMSGQEVRQVLQRLADFEDVRQGEWSVDNDCGSIVLSCSLCDETYWIEREEDLEFCKPNYCPNCGARMDGDK